MTWKTTKTTKTPLVGLSADKYDFAVTRDRSLGKVVNIPDGDGWKLIATHATDEGGGDDGFIYVTFIWARRKSSPAPSAG